jgi:hypothetical protein
LDLTRDCYEKFPIKVQYKVRGRPVSLRCGIKTAGSAFRFCRSPTTFRSCVLCTLHAFRSDLKQQRSIDFKSKFNGGNPCSFPIPDLVDVGANMIQEVLDRSNPAYSESQLPKRQRFVYKGMVGRGLYVLMMQVRKRSFLRHLYIYMYIYIYIMII